MNDTPPDEPNLTGIPEEFPEAARKLATLGTTLVTEGSNLARYMGKIVGTVPEDAVGILLGDPLHAVRTLAAGWYDVVVSEKLERRKAKTEPVSLSVAIPLMRGAYDESRPGLREMWADLVANAMDTERSGRVRLSFVETLKRFDPMDAIVLKARKESPSGSLRPSNAEFVSDKLKISLSEIMLSVDNLTVLNCVHFANNQRTNFHLTGYGEALLVACTE